MDSFTHGLLTFYLLSMGGLPAMFLIPVVIGAMFPDIDILFHRLSNRYPRLFIFTHGGFTHSIVGIFAIASVLTIITALLALAGLSVPALGLTLFIAFLTGSLVHIGLDILAFPGIPIFYPFSSRKYTLGIFPGPSLFIFGVTILFLALVITGIQSLMYPLLYLAVVIGFVAFRTLMKAVMMISQDGVTIPRMNPFYWYIVHENDEVYELESYRVMARQEILGRFPRYQNITKEELAPFMERPEVRRHLYYSYISVAIRTDNTIILFDPLRREKFIWYPPDYASIEIPLNSP